MFKCINNIYITGVPQNDTLTNRNSWSSLHNDINELSPDKLREVVLKFNEQNAFDEMILAPKKKMLKVKGFPLQINEDVQ